MWSESTWNQHESTFQITWVNCHTHTESIRIYLHDCEFTYSHSPEELQSAIDGDKNPWMSFFFPWNSNKSIIYFGLIFGYEWFGGKRKNSQPLLSFIEPIIVLTFVLRVLRFILFFVCFLFGCFIKILNSRHVYYRKGANFSKSRTSSFSSVFFFFSLCKWVEFDLLVYCWYFIASYKNRLIFDKMREREKKSEKKKRQNNVSDL